MGTKTRVGLALLWTMWTANPAVGADWSLAPAVTQKSEFNSNINLTFARPISDYIFTLEPKVDFNYTTEISQLQGTLGLSGQHFITQSQLDHIDQNYQLKGQCQAAPRLDLSLNSSYIVDTTLQQELLVSGLVMSRTPRTAILVNPGVTYHITERFRSTAYYHFNRVLYEDPDYSDYTSHLLGLTFNYVLANERTTLINSNNLRTFLYPGGSSYKTLGIYLGANHKFRENWEFNLLAGININNSNFATQVLDYSQFPYYRTVRQGRTRNTTGTPYFKVSTTWSWAELSMGAGFSRDQAPSAYGYVTNYNRLYAFMRYNLTERWSWTLGGDYFLTTQASQTNDIDYTYYNINTQLAYRLTERWSITPGYRFSQRDDLTGHRSAQAHSAWVMATYAYPLYYQK